MMVRMEMLDGNPVNLYVLAPSTTGYHRIPPAAGYHRQPDTIGSFYNYPASRSKSMSDICRIVLDSYECWVSNERKLSVDSKNGIHFDFRIYNSKVMNVNIKSLSSINGILVAKLYCVEGFC